MWYMNEEQKKISAKCDEALDQKNTKKLRELSEKCRKLAIDDTLHEMIRAKYYYDSFTSLSNYMKIESKSLSKKEKEKIFEETIYLCRKALNIMENYKKKSIENDNELAYFKGVYYQTVVNYCNILVSIGRLPKAIHTIKPIADEGFGMARGNLGLQLYDYAYYGHDNYHQQVLFSISKRLLTVSINSSDPSIHDGAKRAFQERLNWIAKISESFSEINTNNNDKFNDDQKHNNEATEYFTWVSNNGLALNIVNDIKYSGFIGTDSLHLPAMIVNTKEKYPRYHGIFNQIKQEYISSRYLLYEGIVGNQTHFADSGVHLVNTLDYPVYSINVEKVKSAYRAIYSLFDRIAYFLNHYFDLGINDRGVSFNSIWGKKSKLNNYADKNNLLEALKWIHKDLRSKPVSEYGEYIDPILHRTYEIRNIMEHRYLKILTDDIDIENNTTEFDSLAFVVSRDEFHELAINLLRTSREAIILMVMAINIEERRKKEKVKDKFILEVPLDSYDDDWKF